MGSWTDAEKLALLMRIIDKAGPISLSNVDPLPGRTIKSMTHMMAKLKAEAASYSASGQTTAPTQPRPRNNDNKTKTTAASKKRKATASEEAENAQDSDDVEPKKEDIKPKRKRVNKSDTRRKSSPSEQLEAEALLPDQPTIKMEAEDDDESDNDQFTK